MTQLDVLTVPNPVLLQRCDPVTEFDPAFKALISDMFETMDLEKGLGLAAPQVGVLQRVFICQVDEQKLVCVNPEITLTGEYLESEEGCLSIPNLTAIVDRRSQVSIQAVDENGIPFTRFFDGLMAIVIQHEFDHLNGVLITKNPLEIKQQHEDKL